MRAPNIKTILGDARTTGLPNRHYHCIATSPPYFGLREYGPDEREIGDEKTPEEYIEAMVSVGREMRRVLRDDGTWWLNLGDSFGSGKSLLMIPQRVALALQADGWIVRAQIPWVKASCMPESVRDRPTVAHEYVFLLVKSQRYFWDADAVRVSSARPDLLGKKRLAGVVGLESSRNDCGTYHDYCNPNGRNLRTSDFFHAGLDEYERHLAYVRENGGLMLSPDGDPLAFLVNPVGNKLAHFAMWPPRLVAPMIKASTSEKGCCPKCGAQWHRVVESKGVDATRGKQDFRNHRGVDRLGGGIDRDLPAGYSPTRTTLGFSPSCECNAGDPVPCRVLDPFGGSGTTAQVTRALGRDCDLVELMEKNLPIIEERLRKELDPSGMKIIKHKQGAA